MKPTRICMVFDNPYDPTIRALALYLWDTFLVNVDVFSSWRNAQQGFGKYGVYSHVIANPCIPAPDEKPALNFLQFAKKQGCKCLLLYESDPGPLFRDFSSVSQDTGGLYLFIENWIKGIKLPL